MVKDKIARGLASQATKDFVLYNSINGLTNWRLVKAQMDAWKLGLGTNPGIVNLNLIGDSITEGVGSGTTIASYLNSWSSKLWQRLLSKYSDVGEGFIGNQYPVGVSPARWVYAGTSWTQSGVGWINSTAAAMSTNHVGDTATLTFNGTGITLLARKADGGATFGVKVDGGTNNSWVLSGTDSLPSALVITGLTSGSHTVVVTLSTLLWGSAEFFGAYETKGTYGVRVNRMAASGAQVAFFTNYAENLSNSFDYWTPKLSIISLIANDWNTQTPLDTYNTNLQTIISRAKGFGDVLITSLGSINGTSGSHPISISSYKQIAFNRAIQNNCAFLDIEKRWGDGTGFLADGTHPNAVGAGAVDLDIARALEII